MTSKKKQCLYCLTLLIDQFYYNIKETWVTLHIHFETHLEFDLETLQMTTVTPTNAPNCCYPGYKTMQGMYQQPPLTNIRVPSNLPCIGEFYANMPMSWNIRLFVVTQKQFSLMQTSCLGLVQVYTQHYPTSTVC